MTYGFGTREEMEARLQRENERLMRQLLREEKRAEREREEEDDGCCTYCGGSGGADPAICRMCRGTGEAR